MTKFLLAYLLGLVFVTTGLIPIAKSVFSINTFNDAPIFFLVGITWLLLIIVFFNSTSESTKQFNKMLKK